MSPTTSWIQYGIITRAHGVRGELRVVPHDADEPLPEGVEVVRARSPRIGERLLTVRSVRRAHGALLMSVVGVEDRDAAQELGGCTLELDAALLPPPGPGEIYVYELEGAAVRDESGRSLGTVRRVIGSRQQDILEIDSPRGELMLPLVPETLVGFDRPSRTLTVRPVPGLWDETD